MRRSVFMIHALIVLFCLSGPAAAGQIALGRFSQGDLAGWEEKSFSGTTRYAIVDEDGRRVLKAVSDNAASGLFKKVEIDPREFPVIRWSWKIDHVLAKGDARKKEGDDYAARIYVVFKGPVFFQATTVNYIWANRLGKGQSAPNPFAPKNAVMLAVRSGPEEAGRWIEEERNVAEDYRRLFGKEPPLIEAVALMTDTDNTGESAVAYFGDILFSSAP